MTTLKYAKYIFAEAQAAFAPVFVAPNEDDVKRLYKVFVNSLQSIDVPGDEIDLSNILLSDNDHKTKHAGRTFNRMETPLKYYEDGISGDPTNAVRSKAERLWTAMIELQQLIKTVKHSGRAFFKAVVDETWIPSLKEETTFYNKAPLHDFFNQLKTGSGGLEATDIVSLLSAMLSWLANDPCVPEYVNLIKDAQKKSICANLPISNMWLAAIATGLLLAAGSSPKQCSDWDSLPPANNMWDVCRTTFRAH